MFFEFNWNAISGGAPYVTISTLSLAFNSVSIDKLGNPDKVIVGFDEKQYAIGIKAYRGEPNVKSYDFANRVKNGWVRIGCRDFIKYLSKLSGVDFSPAKKYVAKYDTELEILFIIVNEGFENGTDENYE